MSRTERARRLRREQTRPEAILWNLVRGRRLAGFKFRRQVPIDRYVADFVCAEARVIVELDGGFHDDEQTQIRDLERTAILESCGYLLIRFPNEAVLNDPGGVGDAIVTTLRAARPWSLTLPPLRGGPRPLPSERVK
ncbi:endonuclease domain-containing protein [Caulobacter sp. X]|uniref:endonuclease domain-containing protein n=1 Tax=Caulobacter sp. X TaxID=2048901 RepID=UPI000C159681|nr:endonuclease [Caulobacter sp. X]